MKQKITPFIVDHTTLTEGLYLRKVHRLNLFTKIKIWDIRIVSPSSKLFLSAATVHTITHIMVAKLQKLLDSQFIGFYPNASKTGFYFVSTNSLSMERLGSALIEIIEHSVPLFKKEEIPGLTEVECGNPNLFNLKDTSTALQNYLQVLKKLVW